MWISWRDFKKLQNLKQPVLESISASLSLLSLLSLSLPSLSLLSLSLDAVAAGSRSRSSKLEKDPPLEELRRARDMAMLVTVQGMGVDVQTTLQRARSLRPPPHPPTGPPGGYCMCEHICVVECVYVCGFCVLFVCTLCM